MCSLNHTVCNVHSSSQPPAYQRYASLAATAGNVSSLPNQSKAAKQVKLDNDVAPLKPALETLTTTSGVRTNEKPDVQQPVTPPGSPDRNPEASSPQLCRFRSFTVESPTKKRCSYASCSPPPPPPPPSASLLEPCQGSHRTILMSVWCSLCAK